MQSHREYLRKMTESLIDGLFGGDMDKYEKYLAGIIADAEPVMEKYAKQGNEFWLKSGNERIFFQAMEDMMLIKPSVYEKEMAKFLGRDFKYAEISSKDPKVRKKNVEALRKEVLEVCKAKYPDIFQKYVAFQQKEKNARKPKVAGVFQEPVDLVKIVGER